MNSLFPHLLELLEEGSHGLPGVSPRRMFGCDALFAYGNIYGLIWKEGRIGLRLSEPAAYAELMALPGAEPWTVMEGKKMSHWVLVPESFHDEPEQLASWVRRAYDFAAQAPPKKPARAKPAKAPKGQAQAAPVPAPAAETRVSRKPAAPRKQPVARVGKAQDRTKPSPRRRSGR